MGAGGPSYCVARIAVGLLVGFAGPAVRPTVGYGLEVGASGPMAPKGNKHCGRPPSGSRPRVSLMPLYPAAPDDYCAVADAWLLAALSLSTPASNSPFPLQSFQAVAT